MLLNAFPFTSRHLPENLQKGIDWLNSDKTKRYIGDNANFCMISPKGVVVDEQFSRVCHAGVQPPNPRSQKDVVVLWTNPERNSRDRSAMTERREYFDWLVSKSFASEFILYADWETGVCLSTDIPSDLLQSICILFRHIRELPEKHFLLFSRISKSFSGDIAYPISFNTAVGNQYLTAVGYTHRAWCTFTLNAFQKFLNRDFGEQLSLRAKPEYHHRVSSHMVGGCRYCDNPQYITNSEGSYPFWYSLWYNHTGYREALQDYRKESQPGGSKYRPPNPFSKSTLERVSKTYDVTYEELITVGLPWAVSNGVLRNA